MKNPELYKRTVDILVAAYFNDTLEQGDPCGCAVGNIVAANMGIRVCKDDMGCLGWGKDESPEWDKVANLGDYTPTFYEGGAKTQIDATGYTAYEIHLIEKAFESTNWDSGGDDQKMFNGLMEVIETLDQIHENKDEVVTKESKEKFKRVLAH